MFSPLFCFRQDHYLFRRIWDLACVFLFLLFNRPIFSASLIYHTEVFQAILVTLPKALLNITCSEKAANLAWSCRNQWTPTNIRQNLYKYINANTRKKGKFGAGMFVHCELSMKLKAQGYETNEKKIRNFWNGQATKRVNTYIFIMFRVLFNFIVFFGRYMNAKFSSSFVVIYIQFDGAFGYSMVENRRTWRCLGHVRKVRTSAKLLKESSQQIIQKNKTKSLTTTKNHDNWAPVKFSYSNKQSVPQSLL